MQENGLGSQMTMDINGIARPTLNFVVDSGASGVSIQADWFDAMTSPHEVESATAPRSLPSCPLPGNY
jgi:hypothetical protein